MNEVQHRPRTPKNKGQPANHKHTTMGGNNNWSQGPRYFVESFTLCSPDYTIARKGLQRRPDVSFSKLSSHGHPETSPKQTAQALMRSFGRKVGDLPLAILGRYLDRYVRAVNLALQRIYSDPARAKKLGEQLNTHKGFGYNLLRKQTDLCYLHNGEFRDLVFERLHRNVLEHASRIVQSDYTRRKLVESATSLLNDSPSNQIRLLKNKYIPSDLVRMVRDVCNDARNNGTAYYYALAALRQVRKALDEYVLVSLDQPLGSRPTQRRHVSEYLQADSSECQHVASIVANQLAQWKSQGYPFTCPQLGKWSLDYSASTENGQGQGYWYEVDCEREDEILLHIKLPAGIAGASTDSSPYGSQTFTLRFLDWLPRAAAEARKGAEAAEQQGLNTRALQLTFRAAKFEDQHQQFMNTIRIQQVAHTLSRLGRRENSDSVELSRLRGEIAALKSKRRSAPPRLLVKGHKVTLQIPFLPLDKKTLHDVFHDKKYTARAGADRGVRVPVALSVQETDTYVDQLLRVENLLEKRERLRRHASILRSEADLRKNNWEKKRPGLWHPGFLLKKERHHDAVWQKVCRLDREISRVVASRTVWLCEEHNVKTLYFEDLRSYQPPRGRGESSWVLSANLWGQIIETVRYMRESLGHSSYSVWTVNPKGTSQKCHACGKDGIRVNSRDSEEEKKGGEYFYCTHCKSHIHADINAARNIIQVHTSSAVAGRPSLACPSLSN